MGNMEINGCKLTLHDSSSTKSQQQFLNPFKSTKFSRLE